MSSKSKTKSKNTQSLNPWAQQQYENLSQSILGIANRQATPYEGQLSAGADPLQQQAWEMAQQNVGLGQGAVNAALAAAQRAGGYTPMNVQAGSLKDYDLSDYMNPYIDRVAGGYVDNMNRQRQLAINNQAGDFTRQGAFGGSRHGVADSLTNEAHQRQLSDGLNNIYSTGYQNAQSAAQADMARELQASMSNQQAGLQNAQLGMSSAALMGQLGQQQHSMAMADTNLLNQFGAQNQAYSQHALDAQYQEFLRQQQHQFQQAALMQGVLNATPWPMNSTGAQTTSSFDPLGWATLGVKAWTGG